MTRVDGVKEGFKLVYCNAIHTIVLDIPNFTVRIEDGNEVCNDGHVLLTPTSLETSYAGQSILDSSLDPMCIAFKDRTIADTMDIVKEVQNSLFVNGHNVYPWSLYVEVWNSHQRKKQDAALESMLSSHIVPLPCELYEDGTLRNPEALEGLREAIDVIVSNHDSETL